MKNILFILAGTVLLCGCAQYRSTYSHTENITETIEKRPDGILYFDTQKLTYLAMAERPLAVTETMIILTNRPVVVTNVTSTTISNPTNPPQPLRRDQ